ncbi:MAG: hypothetical protein AAGK74_15470 [Chloroflexota bacterium]
MHKSYLSGAVILLIVGFVLFCSSVWLTGCTLQLPNMSQTINITEQDLNAQVATSTSSFSGLYIDLVPGGAAINATVTGRNRTIDLTARTTVSIVNNGVALYVTEVTAGGRTLPAPIVDLINSDLIPSINNTLNAQIPAGTIEDVTITNTDMTVTVEISSRDW